MERSAPPPAAPPAAAASPPAAAPAAAPARRDRALAGIVSMIGGVAAFSVVFVTVKHLGADYAVVQLIFFRVGVALAPILLLVARGGGLALLRTRRPGGHALRMLCGLFSMACIFASFRYLPAADAVALTFAAPLFATALSALLLGETVGWRRWSAVAAGLAGVLVMLRPGGAAQGDFALLGGLLGLAGALSYAGVAIIIRHLSRDEPALRIAFWYQAFVTLALLPVLPFVWITPSAGDLALFVALGLFGGVAQVLMTRAFALAPPAVVMPFEYLQIVFTGLLAWAIWGETPGWHSAAGAAIVIASGLFVLRREARLARLRRPSAP